MFNKSSDNYSNVNKNTELNTYVQKSPSKKIWRILNIVSVAVFVYFIFAYIKNETTMFSNLSSSKQAVLGVSETVDENGLTEEELIKILRVTEYTDEEKSAKQNAIEASVNSMKVLMSEPSIQSQTSYSQEINRELDDKDDYKGRLVVVKQGDTLASISEQFYGNSMDFSKIIKSNPNLSDNLNSLEVGQVLNVPY